jgi:co-chaperonin GroES (HSP10)
VNFIPAHRHILVEKKQVIQEEEKSLILVPEDYKPKLDEYVRVTVVQTAEKCTVPVYRGDELVIREAFIEELILDGNAFYLVLENHVMGIIKNER